MDLPFTTGRFVAVAVGIVIAFHVVRKRFGSRIPYSTLLLASTAAYWLLCLREKLALALALVAYEAVILRLFKTKFRRRGRGFFFLVLALPLLAQKAHCMPPALHFNGLSYLTFRSVQLLFDPAEGFELSLFASYLLFFPSMLAGPIDRYKRFRRNVENGYAPFVNRDYVEAWRRILEGILLRFGAAEIVSRYWLDRLDPTSTRALPMLGNAVAFSLHFYLEFAGYSSMAIGLGRFFGIDMPENFDKPYLSENHPDFWRRFHITLGSWLRDFVFMPLYKWMLTSRWAPGSRLFKQNAALYLTFQLMGAWNGLAPRYLVSGGVFGVYAAVHNTYVHQRDRGGIDLLSWAPRPVSQTLAIALTLSCAIFSFYLFSGRFPYLN